MGAGSVGCFVGGKLCATGNRVTLVGRPRIQQELAEHSLTIQDFDRPAVTTRSFEFAVEPGTLADCDAVLVCVKSTDTPAVGAALASLLKPSCAVASLQNGMRNAPTLREQLGEREVLATVVEFNVVSRGQGLFHRAMSGGLLVERPRAAPARELVAALAATDLGVETRNDLAPDQWTKLIMNLNNAVSALSGAPTRELLLSPAYRRIIAAIIDEALDVLKAAHVRPAKLRGVPVGVMPLVLRLPTPLMRLVTRAQLRVDPQARSSMCEDLSRHRPTEVDFLNGEIVRLAEQVGADAPVNRRIIELVREAEAKHAGPPDIPAEVLWRRVSA